MYKVATVILTQGDGETEAHQEVKDLAQCHAVCTKRAICSELACSLSSLVQTVRFLLTYYLLKKQGLA